MKTDTKIEKLAAHARHRLEKLFNVGAAKVPVKDAYWIHGSDCGLDYCYSCAEKIVAKLKKETPANKEEYFVDGGWRTEHDIPPFCDTCGCRLDGSLTDYGAAQELDHFVENGFNPESSDDCYSMSEVISTRGWEPWSGRIYRHEYERERDNDFFIALYALGNRILETLDEKQSK